jgi:hypothetical protein
VRIIKRTGERIASRSESVKSLRRPLSTSARLRAMRPAETLFDPEGIPTICHIYRGRLSVLCEWLADWDVARLAYLCQIAGTLTRMYPCSMQDFVCHLQPWCAACNLQLETLQAEADITCAASPSCPRLPGPIGP